MTQKLLPLAAAMLALSAGASQAADDKTAPSVTLYGVLHASVDVLDNDDSTEIAVSSNSSRLGIKGEKALSESSTLTYLAEWQIRASGEGENLSRRNQWLGVKQSYGEWRVGRIDTPLKNLRGKVDVFYSDQLGENRTVTAQTGFDERLDNVIQLELGTGALRGVIYYSTDSNLSALGGSSANVDDNDYDVWSVTGLYDTGSWFVGAGYESRSAEDKTAPITELEDPSALRIVGGFKFAGDHRLNAYYETADDINGVEDADRDTYGVSYAFKTGDNTFKAGLYIADDIADIDETGGRVLSLGLDHAYGKNTIAYVVAAFGQSDDLTNMYSAAPQRTGHDGRFEDDGDGVPEAGEVEAGASTTGISVGIRHQF